jgi:hypothetical protein
MKGFLRINPGNRMKLVWVFLTAIGIGPALASPLRAEKPPTNAFSPTSNPSPDQIQLWIEALRSDSFASRELSFQLLKSHPQKVIPTIAEAIRQADEDAAHRLIRLLSGWSNNPDEGYGRDAFAALEKLAKQGVTSRSQFAESSTQSIAEAQASRAKNLLNELSAFVGFDSIQLFAFERPDSVYSLLRIDEAYVGTVEQLTCLRWLREVEVVRLDGERIDGRWLEKVVTLPNLITLQLRHTSISDQDLNALLRAGNLKGLEVLYSPITDGAINTIASLPKIERLRLFGTKISQEGIGKLKNELEGMTIAYGRGGFLGVSCPESSLNISSVTPGGAADQAGLIKNDRIIKIQNKDLNNFGELRNELANYYPGDEVTLVYQRPDFSQQFPDGRLPSETFEVQVKLGEQP